MFKPAAISFLLFLFLLGACSSASRHCGIYTSGGSAQGKKNKDMLGSKEILITSLFVATSHVPEELIVNIEFYENGKSSLSKEAKNKIAKFASYVLAYEDYSITVKWLSRSSGMEPAECGDKISLQRAENVKKALTKNGVDKDKIELAAAYAEPALPSVLKEDDVAEMTPLKECVIIEAELW